MTLFSVDLRPVLRVVGLLLCGLAFAMFVTSFVDAKAGSPDWRVFMASAAITTAVGGILVLGNAADGAFRLSLRQAFLMTSLCWLAVSAFGALPFLGLGLPYTDAFFESISGLTTTGATVLTGLDTLPPGILFWRSLLQWIGGVGIVVMAIIILPFLRIGGMQLFHTESAGRSEKIFARPLHLAAWIVSIYSMLTLLCVLSYAAGGMTPFDAICHAMSTVATGGYSTHDASFAYFENGALHWVATFFMLAGALPFVAYIRLARGNTGALIRDVQARTLLALLVITSVGMAIWYSVTYEEPFFDALRLTAFNVTSVITTTGFASADYSAWGPLSVGAFLILMFIGGCTGSTSGGIKIYRYQILWLMVRTYLRRLVSPNRVVLVKYSGRRVEEEVITAVLAFIAMFLGIVALSTVALSAMGLDLVTAFSASATAITNVGPGLGEIVGPAGNFSTLPDGAKWILSATMLMGRLEVFTVLVLFDPHFWRG